MEEGKDGDKWDIGMELVVRKQMVPGACAFKIAKGKFLFG